MSIQRKHKAEKVKEQLQLFGTQTTQFARDLQQIFMPWAIELDNTNTIGLWPIVNTAYSWTFPKRARKNISRFDLLAFVSLIEKHIRSAKQVVRKDPTLSSHQRYRLLDRFGGFAAQAALMRSVLV